MSEDVLGPGLAVAYDLHLSPPTSSPVWEAAQPGDFVLREDDVHVWRTTLDAASACDDDLGQILTPHERSRAARFRRTVDRRRFIVARGLLRYILASYLREDPASLRFGRTPYGKPFLLDNRGAHALRFNVSHAEDMCLYAISWRREVGIDVERIHAGWALGRIAARFFSPSEANRLEALPTDARLEAFFRCWTRTEAYLKAKGQPLAVLDQSSEHGHRDRQPEVPQPDGFGADRWRVEELSMPPEFAAALAAQGQNWCGQYSCWPLEELRQ